MTPDTTHQAVESKDERINHEAKIRKLENQVEKLDEDLRQTREMLGKALMELAKHQGEFRF